MTAGDMGGLARVITRALGPEAVAGAVTAFRQGFTGLRLGRGAVYAVIGPRGRGSDST